MFYLDLKDKLNYNEAPLILKSLLLICSVEPLSQRGDFGFGGFYEYFLSLTEISYLCSLVAGVL